MDYLTELYLSIAAVIALACGVAVVLVILVPDVYRAWRRHQARRRARAEIRELARQTIFLTSAARQAEAAGFPGKARLFRSGAADAAKFAFQLSQAHFPRTRA